MNLTELKNNLKEVETESNKIYSVEVTKFNNKVDLYFNTLFANFPFHSGLVISATKNHIGVKINGWGLDSNWHSPIEFEFGSWALSDKEIEILPLTKLEIARINLEGDELKNEQLIKNYTSFLSTVGSYTDSILLNRETIGKELAKFSKEFDLTYYFESQRKVWALEREVRAEEDRIEAEELAKISSMTEFVFDEPLKRFFYAGERWDYISDVTRIKVIKKNKTKTWIELWYRYSNMVTLADGNYEYVPVDCKFNVDEIYTKYFDEFVADYYQNTIKK